eukprot:TRINITY_DN239_c3_g1_i1.p1 TRINITY_DN239_c3_g1~~TRINITY_DN239_c3_g1_i1.p1  ORF type:complete len:183 (+),score=29.42 TRINITY_DN239_c3_g1_i1:47-595(+)
MIATRLMPRVSKPLTGFMSMRKAVSQSKAPAFRTSGMRWCTEKAIPSSNMPESFSSTDEKIHIEKDGKCLGGSGIGTSRANMAIMFECRVCQTQAIKQFSRSSYEKGVVLIECPGCKNKHVIADNLGWFMDMGENNNIEKQMKAEGTELKRMSVTPEQYQNMLNGGTINPKDGSFAPKAKEA